MANDFYLTLPSNASMNMYPDNTLADLPQRIDLSGEWECGLAEIQYPHTWYNITEEDTCFFHNEKYPVGLTPITRLALGFYKGPIALVIYINTGLKRVATVSPLCCGAFRFVDALQVDRCQYKRRHRTARAIRVR